MNPLKALGEFWESAKRVLIVSKKPDGKEYTTLLKITGLGILLIGFIGYVIYLIFTITGLGT